MLEFLTLTLLVVSGTGGELCVSHAMKQIGEVHDFRPLALIKFVLRALRVGWMWLGVAPDEPPTPTLSKVRTRRVDASASISAGSQLSRFPRKC